jgi:hypothetical protein
LWTLLCLAQPRVGLAVAAVLLPFYFQHKDLHLVDSVLAVPPATVAVACLLPAVIVRARRRGGWFTAVDAVALAFLGISLLSAAGAWQWLAYWQGLLDLVLLPLALWFALRILDDAPFSGTLPGSAQVNLAYVMGLALFAGGVLTAVWGVMAWFGGQGVEVDGLRRLVGPHFSPNHTALYLVRTLFLGIGLAAACSGRAGRWACRPARRRADWTGDVLEAGDVSEAGSVSEAGVVAGVGGVPGTRMARLVGAWLWAASVLVLMALVLTGSRGALLLGIPAGTLVLAGAALRQRPGLLHRLAAHSATRWVLLGGMLLAAVSVLLLWGRLFNQQTLHLRIDLWEGSLRLWRDHLLLGVGPGGFFWTYPAYLLLGASIEPNQLHPHNIWLEVATTWGLLGFAWLGLLLWYVVGAMHRRRARPAPVDWLSVGLVAALLAAAAHAQVDAFFLLPDLAGWNALALALLVSRWKHCYSAG